MPLSVEQTIKDRYQIRRVISTQGGFGTTYLAYDSVRQQEVVLKESKTAADIEQDALLSELQILQNLNHPRLPKVYEGFFHQRQLYIAMQYIPGRDVSSYVAIAGPDRRVDPPDRPTVLRWIIQTLEALTYLHSQNIVHRDIKPSNLRIHTDTGDIFLLDFGISSHVSRSLIRAHSPYYSPPEQHDPKGITTPASDVYAVGATLYLLLTGREPPYRDDHTDKTLRLPTEENQTIPEELENIVVKAMAYQAIERFPDARAMLDQFQRLGYAQPISATDPSGAHNQAPQSSPAHDQPHPARSMTTYTLPDQPDDAQEQTPALATALPIDKVIRGAFCSYDIRKQISSGGFGTTYLAFAIERKQEVVIKASKASEDATQNSLLSERELLSKLKHPRLPAVYDAFFYKGLLCIEMQYIRGRDVSSYLQNEPVDRRTAMLWVRQLLEALAYLHKRNIVHCDVKPSNLRIDTENGNLFLLDFGISQQNNHIVVRGFSRYYSAPEQRSAKGQISPATDVYGIGAILYHLLTGVPPPEATRQTQPILFEDSDSQAIPEDLKRITRKALRIDPADRYPHAQAMLDDLQRLPYARPAPSPLLMWGVVGIVAVALVVLIFAISARSAELFGMPAVSAPIAEATVVQVTQALRTETPPVTALSSPEPEATLLPTLASTIIVLDGALMAPTSQTPSPTEATLPTASISPNSYFVRQIEIVGQEDSAAIHVGKLPVQLTLLGERLEAIQSVVLQPKTPGQRAITLTLSNRQFDRVAFELASLPSNFRGGEYELLINGERNRTLVLRDFIREARLQGVKFEYRYLAAIRPLPRIRYNNQDIAGPFAMLYPEPDPSGKAAYLRNGDLVEILDDTTNPDFYRVRIRENFDSSMVGREGWIWAWIVEGAAPAPPTPGAIQMPYNIRGESQEQVIEWLTQRGVSAGNIAIDRQSRERIPEIFDSFQPNDVVSSEPAEGAWIALDSKVVLGIRAP